eukprot:Nk52_evm2s243 gene=Nk52_evmTU2s243
MPLCVWSREKRNKLSKEGRGINGPIKCRNEKIFYAGKAGNSEILLPTGRLEVMKRNYAGAMILEALIIPDKFQHILRIMNTNVDGKEKIAFALTSIRGCGRRYAILVCKKADVDLKKRAGELSEEEVERIVTIMQNPRQYKIPDWFLNRQKDIKDGKYSQLLANGLDNKLREDLERLKKIRTHRGIRHYWGLRVRGQHTKTTGRRGRTVGVAGKK